MEKHYLIQSNVVPMFCKKSLENACRDCNTNNSGPKITKIMTHTLHININVLGILVQPTG